MDNIHLVVSHKFNYLSMQILEENLTIMQSEVEPNDWSGKDFELLLIA
jgi:hypothetical protein